MGQSAPAPSTRPQRPSRVTPQQRRQQRKEQELQRPLQATEQERSRQPTLKEQWQMKREANAITREANAAERKRKKEVLHAALVAQQKQQEAEADEDSGGGAAVEPTESGRSRGVGVGDGDGVADDQLEHAQAAAALTQAQITAQLAAFQTFMLSNPDVEAEIDSVGANPADMFDRDTAAAAAHKTVRGRRGTGGGAKGSAVGKSDDDDDDAIANVSVHSSDYADEELMQGLEDLDAELEDEFQQTIDAMEKQIAEHKQQALVELRTNNDKAAALQELQKAKQVEAQMKKLLDDHATPLRVQIEEQEKKIAELEDLVATRKQDSLVAFRGGDKPTALELLKEAKGFEKQLEEARATAAALAEQKEQQLRSTGTL
ncbi:hypothetical protein NESM_000285400 [Novymonas esmeraldas]|uniref:Uncharacterized protein n=1 Tax=Novymonas esmeraldas TaxID=1808958 RepID=A0AAW0FDY8_9TRYP